MLKMRSEARNAKHCQSSKTSAAFGTEYSFPKRAETNWANALSVGLSLPFQWLNLPTMLCAVLSGLGNPQIIRSQPKSLSWSSPIEAQNEEREENKEILCLNSSKLCVEQLTVMAIANSSKLQQSESRIALIEQRLAVTEDRIDYTSKKKWTNYIFTNPVNIIQNLFGGGGVQRDNPRDR